MDAFWSTWERPRSLAWKPLGGPLASLTRVPASKIQLFVATRGIPMISCPRRLSRGAFGCYLEVLFVVQSCFFTFVLVVRSWILRSRSEGHCGRCALQFLHALDVFYFSAIRLDLLFLLHGSHVMPTVCLHGYAALSRGSPCMTNDEGLYEVSNFSIGSL